MRHIEILFTFSVLFFLYSGTVEDELLQVFDYIYIFTYMLELFMPHYA